MKSPEEALRELEALVDALVYGKKVSGTPVLIDALPEQMRPLAERLCRLSEDLGESVGFARAISGGDLKMDAPSRRNYLAGPLKELHSQLVALSFNIQQLLRGNMVSKMYYDGELFYWYNKLVEREVRRQDSDMGEEWGAQVNSWRYHQVLSAINQLHILVLEVDASGKIVFANPPAREVFPEASVPYDHPGDGQTELITYLCGFKGRVPDSAVRHTAAADGFPDFHELYDTATDAWYKITSDLIHLVDGSYGILHMIDDISEWKHHEEQLTITANFDALTGAYTRKAGIQKLHELIRVRDVRKNCIAFVDIDGLKTINDQFGHGEGDFAIRSIANVLITNTREGDWVVRYGGDEFLVVFMNCEKETAQKVILRMEDRLEEVNRMHQKPYHMAFSAGLSEIDAAMEQIMDVISAVDKEMYIKKEQKKALRNQAK